MATRRYFSLTNCHHLNTCCLADNTYIHSDPLKPTGMPKGLDASHYSLIIICINTEGDRSLQL